ncbi:MAG: YraN family protein [Betaproteobacteria bacterium]|nr:YraN family protein [Betaproteobacteria bacterium]
MTLRGRHAENLAALFLQQQGLKLVARNYRCRFGEIDLIAREGNTLVFVEVRMRASDQFGGAAASITAGKRRKLLRTARHYLAGATRAPPCRFDALLVSGADNSVEWLKNAFGE